MKNIIAAFISRMYKTAQIRNLLDYHNYFHYYSTYDGLNDVCGKKS